MSDQTSTYEGEKITIRYDRRRCIHVGECGRGSKALFDGSKDPWCSPDAVTVEEAVDIVERCPTGALTYARKDGAEGEVTPRVNRVQVSPGGPLYVRGNVTIKNAAGEVLARETRVALCRCGQSKNKPYCDGAHADSGFWDSGAVAAAPGGVEETEGEIVVTVLKDAPLLVAGPVTVHASSGRAAFRGAKTALCRCGQSKNKPFCDGSHGPAGFVDG